MFLEITDLKEIHDFVPQILAADTEFTQVWDLNIFDRTSLRRLPLYKTATPS